MIKLTFEYYDLYDNYYNEDIFISIQNVSMKYDFDNKIKIKSRLDEINKDFIVEANRNTQEQHCHDKYFN
ncbi:hypothetical protein [Staphylococcus schweitzeri]|nr:hypothetical protein [Staphylococcus schweitzeri]